MSWNDKLLSFPKHIFCIYTEKIVQSLSEEKDNFSASRVRFQRAAIVPNENRYARAQNGKMTFPKPHAKLNGNASNSMQISLMW